MIDWKNGVTMTAIASLLAMPAAAATSDPVQGAQDGEWISLSGTVVSSTGSMFTLDYGEDEIVVEMDDFDTISDNVLLEGDRVTVTGLIDADFVADKQLEAGTVYVDSLNEYFYASAADEESGYHTAYLERWPTDESWLAMSGEVTGIDGETFTLDTGITDYTVDTTPLGYNPLDEEGLEKVEVGERVVVYGILDDADLFEGREIEATSLTTLTGYGGSDAS